MDNSGASAEIHVRRCRIDVLVCCRQRQLIAPVRLDEQGINRANLEASFVARLAEFSCCDVVLLIGLEKGEHREALQELLSVLGPGNRCRTSWSINPVMKSYSQPCVASA